MAGTYSGEQSELEIKAKARAADRLKQAMANKEDTLRHCSIPSQADILTVNMADYAIRHDARVSMGKHYTR